MREDGETAANSSVGDDVVSNGDGKVGRDEGRLVLPVGAAGACGPATGDGGATAGGGPPTVGGSLGAPNSDAATDAGLGAGAGFAGLARDTSNDWPSAEPL